MKGVPNWQEVWRELFWDMFKPTLAVEDALAHSDLPERYAIINVRFINSLGAIEETDYNAPLPDGMQTRLIDFLLNLAAVRFVRIREANELRLRRCHYGHLLPFSTRWLPSTLLNLTSAAFADIGRPASSMVVA